MSKKEIWATMVTPFKEDYSVDYEALEKLIEWYIANGVDGLFAACQSSEIFYLTLDEREKITRFVVEKTKGRVPVVSSGHTAAEPAEQIKELRRIADCGVNAVVLISNRLAKKDQDDEVWKGNAQYLLDGLPDVPVGIYECPYPYKRLLTPELIKWCSEQERFVFIKDTCCDVEQISRRIEAAEGRIKIYNANSATFLESVRAGADGFCGVMANFCPKLFSYLAQNWELEPKKAEIIQDFITAASFAEMQQYPLNAKYFLKLEGVPMDIYTRCRDEGEWKRLQELETRAFRRNYMEFLKNQGL
ncbi:MAG: dihydrodipicolinate synthase family protein [Eubacteriales bacterium]|nr:dihydrodipicolinate synthase family protein [Eubacteriales bacterium]